MNHSRRTLQPSIVAICGGYLGTDTRPEEPGEIEALASHIATNLCNSQGDLAAIRADIALLLEHDEGALLAFDSACSFDWLQNPAELAALDSVLSECLKALDFRISHESKHRPRSTGCS